ncbi:MAG TPA: tyrosine-type recombinase/integrase, partial [Longimicrobiales bacterium]|nr:tyrosine-type recombinase/integrase [Longimicrobiales bacterium]
LDRVLATVEATAAPGTIKQYQVIAGQLRREFGNDYDPAALTKAQAEEWLHRKRGKKREPWSPRTQAQKCALAGRVWKEAGVAEHPWREAVTPDVRATRFAFLQPEEWRVLAGKVNGLPVAAALALGCLAGLRLREVIYLRPEVDVDMERRRLKIQARDGAHPWRPKTERGERSLRIGDELLSILRAHIDSGYSGGRYLIRTPGPDRPIHPSTLARWTEEAFTSAGIRYGRDGDGLTFHSLRHTFASWLVQRDVQLMKVAKLLGDTELEVARTYGHLLPEDLDRAVDLVNSIAGGSA